ncbi:Rhamnulokinase [Klebsiella aerogenes]|nr:Rhamnulokinase [Klebsiella aerogenes]
MSIRHCVAVDLGASSGRVMLASYQSGPRALTLREIHRFTNSLQKVDGFDCWDVDSLEGEIRRGLEKVCEQGILIDSIGIDTWGVDYVLLDKQGQRVGLPISYRDDRTQGLLRHAEEQLAGRRSIAAVVFSFCRLTPFTSCAPWWSSSRSWSVRPRMPC